MYIMSRNRQPAISGTAKQGVLLIEQNKTIGAGENIGCSPPCIEMIGKHIDPTVQKMIFVS